MLFDLDGTLLDTLRDLAEAMNAVLADHRFPEHPVSAYRLFVGDGMEELVRRVLPRERRDPETVAACLSAMRREYGKRWMKNSRPFDGVPELLDALVERGMRLSVLSNKPDDFTKTMVAALVPRWRFAPVLGVRPGGPRKPDPAGALAIARALAVPPDHFLYLGDTGIDMRTATAAGMYPVGALWGFRTAEELKSGGAKTLIGKPEELLAILA